MVMYVIHVYRTQLTLFFILYTHLLSHQKESNTSISISDRNTHLLHARSVSTGKKESLPDIFPHSTNQPPRAEGI